MIYAIVPVKDRLEYTIKCIDSFLNQSVKDIKVVIVNDGSIDDTSAVLKSKYPIVDEVVGDGNLWCMGAFAKGIEYVREKYGLNDGDYILTQNQDAYFDTNFVFELLNANNQVPNSVVGSINYSSVRNEPIYHIHKLSGGVFKPTVLKGEIPEIVRNCDTLNTRGTLFPANVMNKIGNFSKLFPHYAGDYEITCRAKKQGFELVVATKSVCYSWDDNKNLAARIREKKKKTFKDMIDLFTSRRSPIALYYSNLLVILHVPFPQKILGILRINAYAFKIFMVDYLIKSVILGWKN